MRAGVPTSGIPGRAPVGSLDEWMGHQVHLATSLAAAGLAEEAGELLQETGREIGVVTRDGRLAASLEKLGFATRTGAKVLPAAGVVRTESWRAALHIAGVDDNFLDPQAQRIVGAVIGALESQAPEKPSTITVDRVPRPELTL